MPFGDWRLAHQVFCRSRVSSSAPAGGALAHRKAANTAKTEWQQTPSSSAAQWFFDGNSQEKQTNDDVYRGRAHHQGPAHREQDRQ
jgi:hypothetical protein